MLSVESVLDVVADINLVNDLIGVFLQSCSEDDNLIVLRHRLDELHTARSHKEEAIVLIFNVVDQCLIEIKDETVAIFFTGRQWVKERWRYLGQIGEIVREDCGAS